MVLSRIDPTDTKSWKKLKKLNKISKDIHIKDLFEQDNKRFEKYHIQFEQILFDYSKNRVNDQILKSLFSLTKECKLNRAIDQMFMGAPINETENRAVLHTALRDFSNEAILVEGKNIKPQIKKSRQKMQFFCKQIHEGIHLGYTGKRISQIVNIGIGGSDLGPNMVTEALRPYWIPGIQVHFVSNVDGTQISECLKKLNPETTLFLIASKTFTTQETMTNAQTARDWFLKYAGNKKYIEKHFIALSTNREAVTKFGISADNMFEFWDWVGGRYSLWSAIGLSIALTIGYDNFSQLLHGAQSIDKHFRSAPFEKNIPVIMGLIGIWNRNFLGASTESILPYDQYLHRFPAYFQQGNMESNGKYVNRSGKKLDYQSGPVIWGEPGTNGQHAFYQLIHQGTELVPCDFIAPARSHNPIPPHHTILVSNFFAQTQALAFGKTLAQVKKEMKAANVDNLLIKKVAPFRVFEGNRPTNSFLIDEITPYNLGSLIALYEHKIFVQGIIWNIFSFDQWGVEYGKQLASKILPKIQDEKEVSTFDSSTNGLINQWKKIYYKGK